MTHEKEEIPRTVVNRGGKGRDDSGAGGPGRYVSRLQQAADSGERLRVGLDGTLDVLKYIEKIELGSM